jgi:hypothetical protein
MIHDYGEDYTIIKLNAIFIADLFADVRDCLDWTAGRISKIGLIFCEQSTVGTVVFRRRIDVTKTQPP